MKLVLFTLFSISLFSCQSEPSLIGSWEKNKIIIWGGIHTIDVKEGSLDYFTITFKEDGKVVLKNAQSSVATLDYTLQNDTIRIFAPNGRINIVPIVKLTHSELHTLHIADSSIYIYKRQ